MGSLYGERVDGLGRFYASLHLLRERGCPETALPGEGVVGLVEGHSDAAFFVPALLALQASGEGAAYGVGEAFPGLAEREEPVAHPPTGRAVAADVAEAPLVVAVGRAEGDLLDGLVYDEAFGFVLDDAQAVA